MEDFISIGKEPAVPGRVKNGKEVTRVKKGKGKKIMKGKKAKMENKLNKQKVTEQTPSHRMKLIFQQRCPEISEVRQLHPLIRFVSIPKRPPSVRHCFLKFKSAEELEEVRSALHKKHVDPFRGILKCCKTQSEILNEIKTSSPELLDQEYLTSVDIKHAKFVHNKKLGATIDVKCNSTARELFVRYGIPFVLKREKLDGMDAPSISMGEERNGKNSPSISTSEEEEDSDMSAPEVF